MEEILEIVALEIKRSGYSKHLHSGIILTGGGSLIRGTAALARDVLGMPVKIGIPSGFSGGFVNEVENPMYSTCVGLVMHGMKGIAGTTMDVAGNEGKSGIIQKIIDWFNEL